MLQKIYLMVFERYIPEFKKYDGISFLHQPMASGQPLKIVQRHMAHPVEIELEKPLADISAKSTNRVNAIFASEKLLRGAKKKKIMLPYTRR